ncbi:MAG: hypothetical protein PHD76_00555 [Methylacidiphilales bacterium]|nr:hypothetical protein [Candidatus Methylacidiphilales bacterium]
MNPQEKRNRWLRVRLNDAEEAAIFARYQRRKVPALVRALLLGTKQPEGMPNAPIDSTEILWKAQILSQLQSISRAVNEHPSISAIYCVKLQAALLAILNKLEGELW